MGAEDFGLVDALGDFAGGELVLDFPLDEFGEALAMSGLWAIAGVVLVGLLTAAESAGEFGGEGA